MVGYGNSPELQVSLMVSFNGYRMNQRVPMILTLFRYIHQNPVKAGLVKTAENQGDRFLIHSDEEYLVVTRIMSIFALYNVNKHSMPRQKREKSGTGICHVMQGKESKTCPYDFPWYYTPDHYKTFIRFKP